MRVGNGAHLQPERQTIARQPRHCGGAAHPFAPPGLPPAWAPGDAAAALDAGQRRWRTKTRSVKGSRYLFNHRALAKVFRAKLLAALGREGLPLPVRHPAQWVVDCKCVGSGENALVYLGRYLYRSVIQEKDILSCEQGQVRFRYRDSKTGKTAVRTMGGAAFLRLLLQHVLPRGFRRARNFGFLHPNSKRAIALLQVVLKVMPAPVAAWMKPRPSFLCTCCGAPMRIVRRRLPPAADDRPCGSQTAAGVNM
jgi:hypothetical protein